ncbi:hypothetical protein ZHAS_00019584 [Anopheles sinensis]|uniref:Uncharacterized protein n=1 Tax=Anopheles sinensis TaxID=74873 RepID=A0A084WMS9_ANOSI|nr:hypothetical protein ZHAS_00019584 [Anopheles sinensis]
MVSMYELELEFVLFGVLVFARQLERWFNFREKNPNEKACIQENNNHPGNGEHKISDATLSRSDQVSEGSRTHDRTLEAEVLSKIGDLPIDHLPSPSGWFDKFRAELPPVKGNAPAWCNECSSPMVERTINLHLMHLMNSL